MFQYDVGMHLLRSIEAEIVSESIEFSMPVRPRDSGQTARPIFLQFGS